MTDKERDELIVKTNEYVNKLTKIRFEQKEITFCKEIQSQRIAYRKEWNDKHPLAEIKNSKISRWHSDQDLWWGLLCEWMVAGIYSRWINGKTNIPYDWAKDTIRQNEQLLKEGHFDCKDVGHTQVRAAEYSETEPRRLIYRENDFRTKSTQPVVACVINTNPNDLWAVTCGFMSWEDLKNRRLEFWGDPDNRGYPAMFIPYWELTSMDKFDPRWLLE